MKKFLKNLLNQILTDALLAGVFAFCLLSDANGQTPTISWQKCYGGSDWDSFGALVQLSSGNFIVHGNSLSNDFDVNGNHGYNDVWLVKLDPEGGLIDQRCLGGTNLDIISNLILASNDRLILAGETASDNGDVSGNHSTNGTDSLDGWLVEMDTSFNMIRQKCFGGLLNDGFNTVRLTADNGLILSGTSSSSDGDLAGVTRHASADVWVLKLDSAWNISWTKCFGGTYGDVGIDIIPVSGGRYVIAACPESWDGDVIGSMGGLDFWILEVDSLGNLLQERSYGGSSNEVLVSALRTDDTGFILTGLTDSDDGYVSGSHDTIYHVSDYWILKLDSLLNFQWQKCLGGTGEDDGEYTTKDFDGGFIVTGYTNSNNGDVSGNHGTACFPYPCDDIWLTKIDNSGNLVWQKCIGGTSSEGAPFCATTADSGYIVTGFTFSIDGDASGSVNHGATEGWIIKLAPITNEIIENLNSITDFSAYQNNASRSLSLSFYCNGNEHVSVQMLDLTGRVLMEQPLAVSAGFNKTQVQTGNISRGGYMVRLATDAGAVVKKLMVQ